MSTLLDARQNGQARAVVDGTWPRQPYDPLSADEIRQAVDVRRRAQHLGESTRFVRSVDRHLGPDASSRARRDPPRATPRREPPVRDTRSPR